MRILITGITGFVGKYLSSFLLEQGTGEIFGIDIRKPENFPDQEPAEKQKQIHFYQCDLLNETEIQKLISEIKPDYIFHLAAQTNVALSHKEPKKTLEINLIGSLNILESLRKEKLEHTRVLVVCSSDEYGKVYPNELPIKETNPLRPLTPYAVSKICQEMIAYQYYLSYRVSTIRIRAFNHTGPGQTPEFVCPAFAKQIAEAEAGLIPPVIRVGNVTPIRDFSDVRDIVRAYWLVMEKGESGEVYNVCSGKGRTIKEILEILLKMAKIDIKVETDLERTRPVEVPVIIGSYEKIYKQTGWQPTIPIEQTLEDLLHYWREKINKNN